MACTPKIKVEQTNAATGTRVVISVNYCGFFPAVPTNSRLRRWIWLYQMLKIWSQNFGNRKTSAATSTPCLDSMTGFALGVPEIFGATLLTVEWIGR
ncbi:MAG TPA: hypothetical protein VIQ31_08300 [Phormidium sp.]